MTDPVPSARRQRAVLSFFREDPVPGQMKQCSGPKREKQNCSPQQENTCQYQRYYSSQKVFDRFWASPREVYHAASCLANDGPSRWETLRTQQKEKYENGSRRLVYDLLERFASDPRSLNAAEFFLPERSHTFLDVIDMHFDDIQRTENDETFQTRIHKLAKFWTEGRLSGFPWHNEADAGLEFKVKTHLIRRAFRYRIQPHDIFRTEKSHRNIQNGLASDLYREFYHLSEEDKDLYVAKAALCTAQVRADIRRGIFPEPWNESADFFLRKFCQCAQRTLTKFESRSQTLEKAACVIWRALQAKFVSRRIGRIIHNLGIEIEFVRSFLPTVCLLYPESTFEQKIYAIAVLWGRMHSTERRVAASNTALKLFRETSSKKRRVTGVMLFISKHLEQFRRLKSQRYARTDAAARWAILPQHIKAHYRDNARLYTPIDRSRSLLKFMRRAVDGSDRGRIVSAKKIFEMDKAKGRVSGLWTDLSVEEKRKYAIERKKRHQWLRLWFMHIKGGLSANKGQLSKGPHTSTKKQWLSDNDWRTALQEEKFEKYLQSAERMRADEPDVVPTRIQDAATRLEGSMPEDSQGQPCHQGSLPNKKTSEKLLSALREGLRRSRDFFTVKLNIAP